MHARFSERTFREFGDVVSGLFVLREIHDAFEASGFVCGPPKGEVGGARRSQLRGYVDNIDQCDPDQVQRLADALAWILESLDGRDAFRKLLRAVQRDGFVYADGKLTSPRLPPVGFVVTGLDDLDNLRPRLDRLAGLIEEHPAEAIGGSKELVESICKTIVRLSKEPEPAKNADLVELAKATMKVLELVPSGVDEAKKGADIVKRCLQQLGAVVASLGELRNLYGSGHGKDGKWRGLGPRHARLAVGAGSTIAAFLAETYLERTRQAEPTRPGAPSALARALFER